MLYNFCVKLGYNLFMRGRGDQGSQHHLLPLPMQTKCKTPVPLQWFVLSNNTWELWSPRAFRVNSTHIYPAHSLILMKLGKVTCITLTEKPSHEKYCSTWWNGLCRCRKKCVELTLNALQKWLRINQFVNYMYMYVTIYHKTMSWPTLDHLCSRLWDLSEKTCYQFDFIK